MKLSLSYALALLVQLRYGQSQFKFPGPFPGTVTSWGSERLDVFLADSNGDVWHKYHANAKAGWNQGFEAMNISVVTKSAPKTLILGKDQLHVFADDYEGLKHRYWDGSQWQPAKEWELIGDKSNPDITPAVTARGTDRIHIVGANNEGGYIHKYYDGSAWKPDGEEWEDLGNDLGGGYFASPPVVNSWGPDRLDIFGLLDNGTILHKYYDGKAWQPSISTWEQWGDDFVGTLSTSSWGENRLDLWAIKKVIPEAPFGSVYHRYWDGHTLSEWENQGGLFKDAPSVVSWDSNRIDVVAAGPVAFGGSSVVQYKYWDGYQWNPTPDAKEPLFNHGPKEGKLGTNPVAATWGKNILNVFYLDTEGSLKWQLWEGSQWLPGVDGYYDLGNPEKSSSVSAKGRLHHTDKESNSFVVQDEAKSGL